MSTLRTNALEGVDAKNSITIVAGAGNITTTNVQEGLCKAWSVSSQPATVEDSFNVSSQADGGTGNYQNTLTNNMNSTSSCPTGGSQYAENDGFATPTTSVIQQYLLARTDSLSNQDGRVYFHLTGDLA